MIEREMVPWLLLSGIGHAMAGEAHGWRHTACRLLTPSGAKVPYSVVNRKCRKCCKVLETAVLARKEGE